MLSTLLAVALSTAHAAYLSELPKVESAAKFEKASSYAIAPMRQANWVYLGFAPRMMDPSRVAIYLSKAGYTLRVTMEMNASEVAQYPQYLINRADVLNSTFQTRGLQVTQPSLWNRYFDQIQKIRKDKIGDFKTGLKWLKTFFPKNLASVSDQGVTIHFVYPITTFRGGPVLPPDGTYNPFDMEERKDYHNDEGKIDYVFGGFPAIWFYRTRNGVGIHGPIRYSESHDNAGGLPMPNFWRNNERGGFGYDPQIDIQAKYRWDLVRGKDSSGCVRTESMEIRHMLPPSLSDVQRVSVTAMSTWDQIVVGGQTKFVNVEYYVVDPYQPPLSREEWLKREAPDMLGQNFIDMPYLDPSSVEFFNASGSADLNSMTILNRAPYQ